MQILSEEATLRARAIRMFIMDVDGVLTDGTAIIAPGGRRLQNAERARA